MNLSTENLELLLEKNLGIDSLLTIENPIVTSDLLNVPWESITNDLSRSSDWSAVAIFETELLLNDFIRNNRYKMICTHGKQTSKCNLHSNGNKHIQK